MGSQGSPDSLPQYLTDGLERQDVDTLEDVIAYAEQLIDERSQPPDIDSIEVDDGEIVEAEQRENYTEVIKKVRCGKDCSGCPHGPYVYRVQYTSDGLEWEYKGPLSEYGD